MSTQWQQYSHASAYPQHGGYPPNGFGNGAAHPAANGYTPPFRPQSSGPFPHPATAAYPQQQGHHPPQQNGYPQGQPNGNYAFVSAQYPPQNGYNQYQNSHQTSFSGQGPAFAYQGAAFSGHPQSSSGQHPTPPPYAYLNHASAVAPRQLPQHSSLHNTNTNCFNCGVPGHWAQDCTEPRRQFPPNQQMPGNRPPRRFKPPHKPPIITKYPLPPYVAAAQPTPSYSASPAWSQQPMAYPTPSSAIPSPAQSWPGASPHQFDSSYPQVPTPDPQSRPFDQRRPSVIPPSILTPPYGTEEAEAATSEGHPTGVDLSETAAVPKMERSHSRVSVSTNQSVSMVSESDDEEDVEYLQLDVPDMPNLHHFGNAKAPQLVAKPLPWKSETDDVGQLASPRTGFIQSKYHDSSSFDLLEANVRNLGEFEGLEDDPMFLTIVDEPPEKVIEPIVSKSPPYGDYDRDCQWHSRRSASPGRHTPPVTARPRSPERRTALPPRDISSTNRSEAPRDTTPVNDSVYQKPDQGDEFDPFNPSGGKLDDLIRKHYPDAVRKRTLSDSAPPPPPPPPPEEPYFAQQHAYNSNRQRRVHSDRNLESTSRYAAEQHDSSPTDRSQRKRKHDGEDLGRREGQRQRESATKRRSAPRIADVYR